MDDPILKEALNVYPKEIILKDGSGVSLLPFEPKHEKALTAMFTRLSEDDRWFLDHNLSDPQIVSDWARQSKMKRVVSIIALLEGRIIGNAALIMKRYGAKRHIGKVRITVDPGFREKRLGTWLLLDLVNLAMAMGLKTLVIRLVKDRDIAIITGSKRLGFSEKAVLENYLMGRDGQSHHLIIMTKHLPSELSNQ